MGLGKMTTSGVEIEQSVGEGEGDSPIVVKKERKENEGGLHKVAKQLDVRESAGRRTL